MIATNSTHTDWKPRIDDELRDFLPPNSEEEVAQLTQNCKEDPDHKIMPPVQVCPKLDGAIVDGHNQYRIREELGLEIKFVEVDCASIDEAMRYMLQIQFGRRNLATSQRAILAAQIERCSNGGDRKSQDQAADVRRLDDLAEAAGVSKRTMSDATKVYDKGAAPVVDAVKLGTFSVSDAATVVDLPKREQVKLVHSAGLLGGTLRTTRIGLGKSFDAAETETIPAPKPPKNGASEVDGKEIQLALVALSSLGRSMKTLGLFDKYNPVISEMIRELRKVGDLAPLPTRAELRANSIVATGAMAAANAADSHVAKESINEQQICWYPNDIESENAMDNRLYREDLNVLISSGCSSPGCDHKDHGEIFFHCRCEFGLCGKIEVSYKQSSGALIVGCMECGRTIAQVAVANNEVGTP